MDIKLTETLTDLEAAVQRRRERHNRLAACDALHPEVAAAEYLQIAASLDALRDPHASGKTASDVTLSTLSELIATLQAGPGRAVYRGRHGYYVAYSSASVHLSLVRRATHCGVLRPLWPDMPWLDCWILKDRDWLSHATG